MTTRDETRFLQPTAEPAPPSEVALPTTAETPLLAAIRARHGHGPLADMLYTAELKHRNELAERGRQLRARIAVLQEALEQRRQEGEATLEPLQRAMEDARTVWQEATEAYDRRRIANQGALVPLNNEIAAAYVELHRSDFGGRTEQWGVPTWYEPMPEIPRLGFGPRSRDPNA